MNDGKYYKKTRWDYEFDDLEESLKNTREELEEIRKVQRELISALRTIRECAKPMRYYARILFIREALSKVEKYISYPKVVS